MPSTTSLSASAATSAAKTTAVILAGGNSRRFGRDKAFLLVDDRPLIDRTHELLSALFPQVLVVCRDPAKFSHLPCEVLVDEPPYESPLAGIYTAMTYVTTPLLFVCACDMPALDLLAIQALLEVPLTDADAIVPRIHGRYQPLHALYRCSLREAVAARLALGKLKLVDLISAVSTIILDDAHFLGQGISLRSFANVNTIAEWEQQQAEFNKSH